MSDNDFKNFKSYLNSNKFSFETNTEKALNKAFEEAKIDGFNNNIKNDYDALMTNLKQIKITELDNNKTFILELLTEEIVKRYGYREGLYEYYKIHDSKIKRATEILGNPSTYMEYLQ